MTWGFERTFGNDEDEIQLGWTVLRSLLTSTLKTKDDAEIVQIIAEHAAVNQIRREGRP